MAIPSRQIGWGTTDNLLWEISKQIEGISCVVACGTSGGSGTSGTSGISGSSGVSGTSGISGTARNSGIENTMNQTAENKKTERTFSASSVGIPNHGVSV